MSFSFYVSGLRFFLVKLGLWRTLVVPDTGLAS